MEGADFHTQEVKSNTNKEYFSQVRRILKAQLVGDAMLTAICAYATPILRYTFVIMKWTRAELKKLDIKTRKASHACTYIAHAGKEDSQEWTPPMTTNVPLWQSTSLIARMHSPK
eukprot:5500957-Ditylum_brightwellii.AAC.1